MSAEPDESSTLLPNDGADRKSVLQNDGNRYYWSSLLPESNIVENQGSTARDHLANERTFLAWMRTGLALIGASLGLLKWSEASDVEGYLVALIGVVALMMGTLRYFRTMQRLKGGMFEPNVYGIMVMVAFVVAAIITAFWVIWRQK